MAAQHHHHHHHHHNQSLEEKSSSSSFCYTDVPHNLGVTHLQTFDSNPEIYNLTSGIEMIGFQSKPQNSTQNDQNHDLIVQSQDHQHQQEMGFMNNDSSINPSCVFPCEGNERPSQGLSLSLSSSNPSTISLQSFELRQHNHQRFALSSSPSSNSSREGYNLGKIQSFHHHHHQDYLSGKSVMGCDGSTSINSSSMSLQFELMRNSKYMGPAQELLNEFCNLGTQLNSDDPQGKKTQLRKNKEQWEFEGVEDDDSNINNNNNNYYNASSSSSSKNASLYGISLLDLQKRKTKLLGMLEELDRRYKHYCEQMKSVVSSFEAMSGAGSANVYSALASKAMSRHFRCLRDTIVAQIKATKKAMGDKDSSNATVLGTTKGETPRLRILDQNLRQQRAYQQMTMMEAHPWRPQRGLPERSVSTLRAWLFEHFLHPYPSDVDKHILARQTGLSRSQVSNWFINARVRLWKPMVEQMYLEETKEEQDNNNMGSSPDNHPSSIVHHGGGLIQHPQKDQKPDPDQLLRVDPDSLSSIVNTNRNSALHLQQSVQFIDSRVDGFGSVNQLDFSSSSSYNQQHHAGVYGAHAQNDNNTPQQGFGGGNSGTNNVSLTLGLQQHGGNGNGNGNGNGVSLAFYPRDHMEDCQPVHQYSLLDEDQGNNLPYRNLMDAQVLHDFA